MGDPVAFLDRHDEMGELTQHVLQNHEASPPVYTDDDAVALILAQGIHGDRVDENREDEDDLDAVDTDATRTLQDCEAAITTYCHHLERDR